MIGPPDEAQVAYFSMEVGLESHLPTYAGGLGVLAGDTLRSAADLGVRMVGVSLVHRQGYFRQELDERGEQRELPCPWRPEEHLTDTGVVVPVDLEGRRLLLRAWRHEVRGFSGHVVPVYLLDADLPGNAPEDRTLTDRLYGGDDRHRLRQEAALGLGGVAALRALGHSGLGRFHMNEGHSALLTVGLLEEVMAGRGPDALQPADLEEVRGRCVFTTHTPVPAGHDRFPWELAEQVLGARRAELLRRSECCLERTLNMTYLALRLSAYMNGVALSHRQTSRGMFPTYPIDAITNGVHPATWAAPPLAGLFDEQIPRWRRDALYLRYAAGIPLEVIRERHAHARRALLDRVARRTGRRLDEGVLTIGFARRATAYKRTDLLFQDLDRLRRIAHEVGPLQVVMAGKAHPRDEGGKAAIRRVFQAAAALGDAVPVVYLPDYDMDLARLMVSGADLWLNTPQRPQEASGTSGMKAALNGVPSLSVLDGWWAEGHVEGVTGWAIGAEGALSDPQAEVRDLYDKLERVIVPLFYGQPLAWARVMRSCIALNGAFFNTQRMVYQYVVDAYAI